MAFIRKFIAHVSDLMNCNRIEFCEMANMFRNLIALLKEGMILILHFSYAMSAVKVEKLQVKNKMEILFNLKKNITKLYSYAQMNSSNCKYCMQFLGSKNPQIISSY